MMCSYYIINPAIKEYYKKIKPKLTKAQIKQIKLIAKELADKLSTTKE